MWEYPARIVRIIDGDTYETEVDLGWHVAIRGHIRLLDVDCPEPRDPGGPEATAYVERVFAEHDQQVIVQTVRRDPHRSFARYLARITLPDGADLAEQIIDAGHGVPHPKETRS